MPPRRTGALSPLLVVLIEALEAQDSKDRPGEAAALRAFAELARVHIPTRGVLAPIENELYRAVDRIATKHLRLATARKALIAALAGVEPFSRRDEIESAADTFRSVSDVAYFNLGLAFGVTFSDLRVIR